MTTSSTKGQLLQIVDDLGDIYLGMAEKYPLFFEELDKEYLSLKSLNSGHGRGTSISAAYENVTHLLTEKDMMIESNGKREKELISIIDEELEKLSKIESAISHIQTYSEDLEIISLNAMVSALKAGANGGAFPYITKVLQTSSRQSAHSSGIIRSHGEVLDKKYKEVIENIRSDQKSTNEDMGKVFDSLDWVVSSLKTCGSEFDKQSAQFGDAIDKMKKPLYMIVEEVQKHDIVRQSIDHILLSLNEIEAIDEISEESRLNHVKFSCQVYELSRFIIDDIKDNIKKSYLNFRTEKEEVEKIIKELESYLHNKCETELGESLSSRISLSFQEISNSVTTYSGAGTYSHKDIGKIAHHIKDLDDGVARFTKVLSTIRNIHVASRIEVVKLKKLENMDNIIDGIDHTVSKMEDLLIEVGDAVSNFKKVSQRIILDFEEYFSQVKDELQDRFIEISPILETINTYQIDLAEHMTKMAHVTGNFTHFFTMVNGHLVRMEELMEKIDNLSLFFESKWKEQDELFKKTLDESHFNSWDIKGDRIKTLIEKFTIFIHKKKLTGEDSQSLSLDEEHAEASEITLF